MPIYTSHTVIEARGSDKVEQVVIAKVDESFQAIPGTEKSTIVTRFDSGWIRAC